MKSSLKNNLIISLSLTGILLINSCSVKQNTGPLKNMLDEFDELVNKETLISEIDKMQQLKNNKDTIKYFNYVTKISSKGSSRF